MDGEDTSSSSSTDGFLTEEEEDEQEELQEGEEDEALLHLIVHLSKLTCSEATLCILLGRLTQYLLTGKPGVESLTFTPNDGRLSVDVSAWEDLIDLINLIRPGPDWVALLSSAAVIISGKEHTDQNLHCDLDSSRFSACGDYHLYTMILPLSASMGFTFDESTTFEYGIGDLEGDVWLQGPGQYVWFSSFDCWHRGLACPSPRLHLVWTKRM